MKLLMLAVNMFFFYNLFTKKTDKILCRCEAPIEETREAYGCLAIDRKEDTMVALSVHV